ncbi:hypothetical protein GA0115245_140710, partial [Streptomyces sp. di188]
MPDVRRISGDVTSGLARPAVAPALAGGRRPR